MFRPVRRGLRGKIWFSSLRTSFAFSGCGWLTPFHLGVISSMKKHGLINENTICGGTSGGSLAALAAILDIDTNIMQQHLIDMSKKSDLYRDIDGVLKTYLREKIPSNALEKVNRRLFVTVTKIQRGITCEVVSEFNDIDHLIDTIAASCFIPAYSSRRLTTMIRHSPGLFIDGGVFAFMPPIGDIRISPFPIGSLRNIYARYPHIHLPFKAYSIPKLLRWSLIPAPEDVLHALYDHGTKQADFWVERNASKFGFIVSKMENET